MADLTEVMSVVQNLCREEYRRGRQSALREIEHDMKELLDDLEDLLTERHARSGCEPKRNCCEVGELLERVQAWLDGMRP